MTTQTPTLRDQSAAKYKERLRQDTISLAEFVSECILKWQLLRGTIVGDTVAKRTLPEIIDSAIEQYEEIKADYVQKMHGNTTRQIVNYEYGIPISLLPENFSTYR